MCRIERECYANTPCMRFALVEIQAQIAPISINIDTEQRYI